MDNQKFVASEWKENAAFFSFPYRRASPSLYSEKKTNSKILLNYIEKCIDKCIEYGINKFIVAIDAHKYLLIAEKLLNLKLSGKPIKYCVFFKNREVLSKRFEEDLSSLQIQIIENADAVVCSECHYEEYLDHCINNCGVMICSLTQIALSRSIAGRACKQRGAMIMNVLHEVNSFYDRSFSYMEIEDNPEFRYMMEQRESVNSSLATCIKQLNKIKIGLNRLDTQMYDYVRASYNMKIEKLMSDQNKP